MAMPQLSKRVREFLKSGTEYPLAHKYGIKEKRVVNLASNENPFGASPEVARAIKRAAQDVNRYPDPAATELKEAISKYLKVAPESIAVGNGSDELVDLCCRVFMDPGDKALIPIPAFSMYELACCLNGGMPKFWELLKFGWDPEGMKNAMKDAKLVFVGRPNNPTGDGVDIRGLRSLLSADKPVVVDEAYAEFSSSSAVELLKEYKNLVILRTLSKAFGLAGLRVGYAVGDPDVIQALEKVCAPFNVNCLAQVAAVAALHDVKYMKKVVNITRKLRRELYEELSELGMNVFPSDANFIMADVTPLGMSAPELCSRLARDGVYIRDLSGFRGAGTNYVRITVGKKEQNNYLISALKRILEGGKK